MYLFMGIFIFIADGCLFVFANRMAGNRVAEKIVTEKTDFGSTMCCNVVE